MEPSVDKEDVGSTPRRKNMSGKKYAHIKMLMPLFAEIIGSFIFIAVILNLTTTDNGVVAALCIGITLSVVVWFSMNASLGAMNPAVTLALFLRGNIDGTTSIAYVVAQLLGAVLAFVWWKNTAGAKKLV